MAARSIRLAHEALAIALIANLGRFCTIGKVEFFLRFSAPYPWPGLPLQTADRYRRRYATALIPAPCWRDCRPWRYRSCEVAWDLRTFQDGPDVRLPAGEIVSALSRLLTILSLVAHVMSAAVPVILAGKQHNWGRSAHAVYGLPRAGKSSA